jgi:eukaryotic-like serine/threonine-protein kinase
VAAHAEIGAHAQPGAVLLGKYRVERLLGAGGMGAVVAARHLQLDERVAIKFLLGAVANDPIVAERFLREARAAIKIRSEHCVRVLDVGTLETGAAYMVMEYLEGSDLENLVARGGPLPVPDAIDFVMQAAEALAEAHAIGIVHRDLKPANLFLTRRADGSPCVKVLDFGISKQKASHGEMGMTSTQTVFGSPRYMSPEQMRSTRDVDARTDVWSLSTVLHELLSGVPPFDAQTMPELCAKILQDAPPQLAPRRGDVPPALEAAILRGLEKDRDRRWRNMAELGAAIAPFGSASSHASAARIARVLGAPLPVAPPMAMPVVAPLAVPTMPRAGGSTTASAASSVSASAPRADSGARVALAVVGSFLLVGALGVTGWAVVSHTRHPSASSSASVAPTAPAAQAPVTAAPAATAAAPATSSSATAADTAPLPPASASASVATLAPATPRGAAGNAPRGKPGAAPAAQPPSPAAPSPAPPPSPKPTAAPAPGADPFAERKDSF